ncbi:MAG: MG2 domain-containing protein, partial [Planctomycetota bacterium]
TAVCTSWLSAPRGLQPLGVLDTDRSVYPPGATVSWRAVLRESEGGAWTFEPGRPYLVQWREPGGRLLWQEQVQLDAFGTLNGTRVLDPEAPLGGYQILVRDRDRELVRRNFLVQRIELQQVDLSLDAERGVYYRGESVDLRFEARRFYGSPLADAPVRLSTPDGRWHDLRTDADGVVEFSFDTRLMTRSGRLAFVASLPQEGMEVDFSAVLAATGYRARLGLDQEVPLAGRGVRVELSTTLADGTPAARGMQWELQRAGDSGNYRPVEGIGGAVATDDTGLEVWTWTPERGGWYRLRAMGEDRFGNPVVARRDVFVSGDDDPQKLRLLAEAEDLAVGGALAVELINRAGPGLALVTIEGGRILEHHLRELPSGVSTLELPVSGAWFPNVAVAVTMMDGNELHQASRDFRVQRGLEITMSAREGVVLPGQEAVIDLEVRDQLGRPVAASLSLSAVDASLLAQYPTGLVDLRRLPTSLAWREAALQTSSSCWFRYQGQTVQLAEELLQELELQSAAQAWAEGRDQAREGLAYALPPSAPTTPGTVAGVRGRFAADADEDFLGQVEEEMELSELGYLDSISIGGGAGGKSGGRGGVASRKARPMTQEEVLGPDSSLAYWNAAVETGADGKATVRFRMPQRSTRWQLDCRGVAVDGALGQARMELVSRAPFFVDLRTPARLLEGDRPAFLATVTNLSGEAGDVQLELFVDAGSSQQVKQAVAVPAEGEVQVLLHLPEALQVLADDEARVSVVATAFLGADGEEPQELQARFTRNLPMVPWGLPRMVRESGVLAGAGALVELALPPGSYGPDTRLTIEFGSSVDVALLREATRGAIGIGRLSTFGGRVLPPDHSVAGLASALSGRLAAAAHVADSVASGVELGDPAHLRSLASRDLSLLLARQRSDGGWAWSGDRRESLAESTAIGTAALEDARTAGLDVPQGAIDKARGFLKQALPTRSRDGETTAMVLHALALSGNADFGVANRLHRDHRQLSPAGMAYLARALKALDSAPMAEEVVTTLLARRQGPAGAPWPAPWGDAGGSGWCGSGVAMDALALLAVVEVMPGDPAAATLEQALWEQLPWPQGGPHGLAVSALAAARAGQAQALDARVTVSVGDREPNEYLLEDGTRMSLTVPLEGITSESVRLDVSGRGAPAYVVSLEGFDSAPQPQQNGGLSFSMVNMLAPAPSYAGRAIQTGFGVTTGFEGWRNTVGSLDYGAVSTLEIHYRTDRDLPRREVNQDFLVLEVPLPAGAQVVESGLRGDYLDWQQLDGVAVFTLGRPERAGSLRIPLRGLVPGSYRMLPPVLADAYDPSHAAIAEAATLTVLDPGVARSDEYRATPDELYHTGIAAFDAGDRETAWSSLRALDELAGDALRADPMRESTRRLLTMALDRADADAAVRAFEVIKERFPAVIIGFDEIAAVAASYRELEEFERAARIHLAIAGETFGKDLKVAGVLEQQEDFHGAGELMLRLWQEYPDFPSVVETGLTLADRMLQKAPAAHTDVSLREARRDRAVLLFEAVQHLRHFLVLYPTDPLAGDAALNLVSAFLDLEDYDTAAALGAEMVERFPAPRLKDAFGYTQAVAEWYRGDDAAAERLLGGIADAAYEQP